VSRAGCVGVAAALAVVIGAGTAVAERDLLVKRLAFAERGDELVVTASFTELFSKDDYDKLSTGLPTTVVVRAYVFRVGQELPVTYALASLRVVYDLWDEVYVVRVETRAGRSNRRFRQRAEALKAVTELERFPVASLHDVPIGPHHLLAMVIELNPVSSDQMAEMRRWLTRPAGSASLDRSTSFFGSFVSVFVNPKLPEADRVLRIRSQPFYRVER
jgi:hypothetical protein